MFGYAHSFRRGEEEEEEAQYRDADSDDAGLALTGHFIVAKETKSQGAEEGDAHARQREDAEEQIGHQEAHEEDRQENEWEIVCDAGAVHAAAHIVEPVCHVEAEEPQGNEGQQHDLIPSIGETIAVLAKPPEEGAKRETHSAADGIVPVSRDKFHGDHGKGGQHRAGSDVGNHLRLAELLLLRDILLDLCQDFHHEEEEEDRHSGEGVNEDRNNDQKYRQEDTHAFENLQLLEIQLSLLGVNGEPHEDQIGHHDPDGLCRLRA